MEIGELSDSSRLLFDLQKANAIAQSFSGCLEPEIISRKTAKGLVELFNSAFARIWLVEPDGANLKLVASSGLYDRIDGSFARVPMGAYKVGKIAHNRVSFLSNNLAEETWVKDREWAIANQIRGFAGFPLIAAWRGHHPYPQVQRGGRGVRERCRGFGRNPPPDRLSAA